jgi:hypothetical protein
MKNLLVALVVSLAVSGVALPQTVGVGVGPTFTQMNALLGTAIKHATAFYTFDDPANIGDDLKDTYEATDIGTPQVSGGGGGYAMMAEVSDTSCAYAADSDDWTWGEGDGGFCGFFRAKTVTASKYIIAHTQLSTTLIINASSLWQFAVKGEIGGTSAIADPDTVVAKQRYFICGSYNHSTQKASIYVDGDLLEAGQVITGGTNAVDYPLGIGARTDTCADGVDLQVDSLAWYKGSIPPYSSLHNGGKGKRYAQATAGDKVDLVSWWEWNESTGQLEDQHGSHDATSVDTPAVVPGMVERSDSGMSFENWVTPNGIQDATSLPTLDFDTTYSMSQWVYHYPIIGTTYGFSLDHWTTGLWTNLTNGSNQFQCTLRDTLGNHTSTHPGLVFGWNLVACYFDGDDHKIYTSINGGSFGYASTALETEFFSSVGDPGEVSAFRPGAYHAQRHYAIDDTAWWEGYRLTDDDVAKIYEAGPGGGS